MGKHAESGSPKGKQEQPRRPAPDPLVCTFPSFFLQKPAVNPVHVLPQAPPVPAPRLGRPDKRPLSPPCCVEAEGREDPSLSKDIFSLISRFGPLEVLNPPGEGLAVEPFLAEVRVLPQVFPLVLGSG